MYIILHTYVGYVCTYIKYVLTQSMSVCNVITYVYIACIRMHVYAMYVHTYNVYLRMYFVTYICTYVCMYLKQYVHSCNIPITMILWHPQQWFQKQYNVIVGNLNLYSKEKVIICLIFWTETLSAVKVHPRNVSCLFLFVEHTI